MKKNLLVAVFLLAFFNPLSNAQNIEEVKDINTSGNLSSYPFDFTLAAGKLFFIATVNSGSQSVWITKGTAASTKMVSPATGPLNSIGDIAAYNNNIYFSYNDGVHGYELWVSDGTAAGTVLFKDIYAGSSGSNPRAFTVANNKLFFMADDINGERRLYVSDGTSAGTTVIKNNYISLFNGFTDFAVLNKDIYFTSDNGTGTGTGLWKSNGTLAGTKLVKPNIYPGTMGGNYAVLNNSLYFSCDDNIHGSELWVTNGSNAGTHIVKNLKADGGGVFGNGAPQNLIVYNNKIYFEASDDAHGAELFVTDGTQTGTKLVKDIVPGTDGGLPYQTVIYNNLMYFVCYGTQALYKSDGTAAGTKLVKSGFFFPKITGVWKGKLYLVTTNDYSVWQSNGTAGGTVYAKFDNTVNIVYSLSSDYKFVPFKSGLYLSGSCTNITSGYEPCRFIAAAPAFNKPADAFSNQKNIQQQNKDVLTAAFNLQHQQIIINNATKNNFTWQLVSVNGGLIYTGKSAAATTNISTAGIKTGIYFLICTSPYNTEKKKFFIP